MANRQLVSESPDSEDDELDDELFLYLTDIEPAHKTTGVSGIKVRHFISSLVCVSCA